MTIETDQQLINFIERVERLNEEKKGISEDIRDVFIEAKSQGYNPKMMKEIIKIRKKDRETRLREEAELEVYLSATGIE